ncbi:unnamed protein product [Protopolystoma xenopodis]|uniref:Uncharacterized protein n=1 Tax=Protopolystoma xenopodis TaxID=117903 RepID=A0A3S4ZZL2_9PLAT|nr:unnamed protein product [Protopolystoma xenopodis]
MVSRLCRYNGLDIPFGIDKLCPDFQISLSTSASSEASCSSGSSSRVHSSTIIKPTPVANSQEEDDEGNKGDDDDEEADGEDEAEVGAIGDVNVGEPEMFGSDAEDTGFEDEEDMHMHDAFEET